MLKRALALLLTGCMMFDSSAIAALAAEPQTEVVSEVETEEIETEEVETEENEMVSEDVIMEGETVEETNSEEVNSEEKTETEEINLMESVEEEKLADVNTLFEVGSNSVTISVTDTEQKYSFTAPETGVYSFYVCVEDKDSYDVTDIFLYRDAECTESITGGCLSTGDTMDVQSDYMQAGETVYVQMCTGVEGGLAVDTEISLLPEYEMIKQEDGSYTADTSECVFKVMSKAGYENLKTEVSLAPSGEQELERYYYVFYETMDHDKDVSGEYTLLSYGNNYLETYIFDLEEEIEHEFYYILKDGDYNPVAVFTTGEIFTGKATDKSYIVYDTVIEEDCIAMEMEVLNNLEIYYAPADGSESEERTYVSTGWTQVEFSNLKPGTEYSFRIQNRNDVLLERMNITTSESTAEIEMNAVYNAEKKTIDITANVSGYRGRANYAYFYYQYKDALGREYSNYYSYYLNNAESDEDGGKSFSMSRSLSNDALLAGTDYEVTLWIEFGDTEYERKAVSITIPEVDFTADDITLSVTDNEISSGAYVNVSIVGLEGRESVSGTVFYKLHGVMSSAYSTSRITIGASGSKVYLSEIQKGVVYDYLIIAGGVMKELTIAVGEAEVSLVEVEEGINNAFDIVRTFKLEGKEELTGTYYIRMEYRKEGDTSFSGSGNGVELNAENHYQAEFKSAENVELDPNTEYQIKWVITESSGWGSALYTVLENVKTAEAEITFEDAGSYCNEQSYTITLNQDLIANFSSFDVYMYAHIRKQGEEKYTYAGAGLGLYKSNDYTNSFTLENLEPSTTYEVSLRDVSSETNNYTEYAVYTFTTKEDTRKIELSVTKARTDSITYKRTLSGMDAVNRTYIFLFLREKNSGDEWVCQSKYSYGAGVNPEMTFDIGNYNGERLKEDTIYEYKIGFYQTYYPTVNQLEKVTSGEMATIKDPRTVSISSTTPTVDGANFKVSASNLDGVNYDSYIYLFVREKDTEDEWQYADSQYVWNGNEMTLSVTDGCEELKSGTKYEYVMGFKPNSYDDNTLTPDLLKNAVTGTFTTLEDTRTISVTRVRAYIDGVNVSYSLSGMDGKLSGYIVIYAREAGTEDEWTKCGSREVYSTSGTVYSNLSVPETTYEYRIGFATKSDTTVDKLKNVVEGTYTCPADSRSITIRSVASYLNAAEVSYTLNGMDDVRITYVYAYVREKGTGNWEYAGCIYDYKEGDPYSGTYRFNNVVLEPETTYEYRIGFYDSVSGETADNLLYPVEGEFTTLTDTRQIESVNAVPYVTNAELEYTLTGMENTISTILYAYIREQGTEEWLYGGQSSYQSNSGNKGKLYISTNLAEETAYEYQIGFADGNIGTPEELKHTYIGSFTTLGDTRRITDVEITPGMDGASISYTLEGMDVAAYANIYAYVREVGTENWVYGGEIRHNVESGLTGSFRIASLKEEASYEYKIGFMDGNESADALKSVVNGTFTTVKDSRTLTDIAIKSYLDSVEISYKIEDLDLVTNTTVHLFIRKAGTDNTWYRTDYMYYNCYDEPEGTLYANYYFDDEIDYGSIEELKENTAYEYRLGMVTGNTYNATVDSLLHVVSGQFRTATDNRAITEVSVKGYSDRAKVSYVLTGMEVVDDSYVNVYVREKGTENWEYAGYGDYYEGNSEERNNGCWLDELTLKEGTTYEYQMGFSSNWQAELSALKHVVSGEFSTPSDTRAITDMTIETFLDRANVSYSVSGLETAYSTYVHVYVREAGTENAWYWVDYDSFSEDSKPNGTVTIGYCYNSSVSNGNAVQLKENTSYEYRIGMSNDYDADVDNLKNMIVGQFRTQTDTRTFKDVTVKPYLTSAEISYKVENLKLATETVVSLYVRKAGAETEWYESDNRYFDYNDSPNGVMSAERCYDADGNTIRLQEETAYEYQLGIKVYEDEKYVLKQVVSGTFTTAKDMRTIQAVAAPGYATAKIEVSYAGNNYEARSNIRVFYRQKGVGEWHLRYGNDIWNESGTLSAITLNNLTAGTTYEYAAVITDDSVESPDEVTVAERKSVGEFTTKTNTYTVSLNVNQESIAYDKAVVAVTAANGNDSAVKVTFNLLDADGIAQSETVTLKRGNGYKKEVTFTGLTGNTTYRITNAVIEVEENRNWITIATVPCEASFTTKEAVIPTSIMLSAEIIILNAYYSCEGDSTNYKEGFNCKSLSAKLMPENAAEDLLWTTNNPDVATVTEDGMVYATGCGKTEIIVKSKYNTDIKASCTVEVVNYEIIHTDGVTEQRKPSLFAALKGGGLKGLAYYAVDSEGNKQLLEDYTITPVKSGIASWSDTEKMLMFDNVGETQVIFEKDGVKAVVTIRVDLEPAGFAILGLDVCDSDYGAIVNKEGNYIAPLTEGAMYQILGETSPINEFDAAEFTWTSSDTAIATVNGLGQVMPVKTGTVTITATPSAGAGYKQDKAQITITFKELPVLGMDMPFYAVTNVLNTKTAKLSDIALPEGWTWAEPATVLIPGGINVGAYHYTAVYTGDEYYPAEETVSVYVSNITGGTVYETEGSHNRILQVGEDSMKLAAAVNVEGIISSEIYTVEIPEVEGLIIEKGEDGYFTVKAEKTGTYTLKPIVKVNGSEVKLKKAVTYKITAVEEVQAAFIEFTDAEGNVIEDNKVIFKTVEEKENFVLNAIVKDAAGNTIDSAKVAWKITDAAVAAVKADKKNTRIATVTVKGEGHAVITVTAQDKTKYQATLDLEIQNHKPRVNTNKATVNLAYDYESSRGKALATAAGLIEIVPVYGESIDNVQLLDKKGETPVDGLALTQYGGYNYLAVQTENSGALKTGKYACTIRVTVYDGEVYEEYDYPLTVTVSNKKPTVKVKTNNNINLFYTNTSAYVYFTVTNGVSITDVMWNDNSDGVGNGFAVSKSGTNSIYITQENIELIKGKLKDKGVAKGTLTFKLDGYKDTYELKNFAVKYSYKKPGIVSMSASSNVAPAIGQNENGFDLYNKTDKYFIWYNDDNSTSRYSFMELTCEDENVDLRYNSGDSYISYKYHGTKNSYKFTMTLDSVLWRESVKVTHTVKVKNPTPVLPWPNVIFNLALDRKGSDYTIVRMSDNSDVELVDIAITGKDKKSQALIDNNVLMFMTDEESGRIDVCQNDAEVMGAELKKGTYTYKVTPYVTNVTTGQKTALKTLSLTVKIIDTPCKAKVSAKGTIDLSNGTSYHVGKKTNAVWVDESFTNLPTGNYIRERWLEGEYADYFTLSYDDEYGHWFVTVNPEYLGSLKAGQTYVLSIGNEIYDYNGNYIGTIASNTFKITPKQKAPKVTVANNNQTLYAAADDFIRSYRIYVPDYYQIENAYGSIDCNKDGKTDIRVTLDRIYNNGRYCYLNVEIIDRDAVVASAKGKTYTIPVTVKLVGRDGVSKDASVSLKVTVKR